MFFVILFPNRVFCLLNIQKAKMRYTVYPSLHLGLAVVSDLLCSSKSNYSII